jgi:hypothetical protein
LPKLAPVGFCLLQPNNPWIKLTEIAKNNKDILKITGKANGSRLYS